MRFLKDLLIETLVVAVGLGGFYLGRNSLPLGVAETYNGLTISVTDPYLVEKYGGAEKTKGLLSYKAKDLQSDLLLPDYDQVFREIDSEAIAKKLEAMRADDSAEEHLRRKLDLGMLEGKAL